MVAVPLQTTYSTHGTFTWVAPPGVTSLVVACIGGGGGAGSANAATGSFGGGGGAGEASLENAVAVTPGMAYTVTVGAGGTGGIGGAGAPGQSTAGASSSFSGDTQTVLAHGGSRGNGGVTGTGGAGGTGSSNAVSARGGNGDDGLAATNGGGGGGAGGISATGVAGGNGSGSTGGIGGVGTVFSGGNGGAGATTGANGSAGVSPGGGGGGALSTGVTKNGGAGADGAVFLSWTMNDPLTLTSDTTGGVTQFQAPQGTTLITTAQAWGGGAGGWNTAVGSTATCGCSAFTGVGYGSTLQAAATTFDNDVSRPMAIASHVIYYQEEEYPSATHDSQNATTLAQMGVKIFATFKLSRRAVVAGGSTLTTQQTNFAAAIAFLLSIPNINLGGVCIANEPSIFGQHGPFGDGAQKNWNLADPYTAPFSNQIAANNFLAYWAAYVGTAVTALAGTGIPILYKPTVTSQNTTLLMFPGAPSSAGGCDGVIIDWYATDDGGPPAAGGTGTPFGSANIEGKCDQFGIPLGLGEWGPSAGAAPTVTVWNQYITEMGTGFTNRFNAAKPVLDVVYFGGLSNTGANFVTGPTDYKVSGIQQIFDLFSSQKGGSGGGGGEFAQESSLAVTGTHFYTISVGAGGADRVAGGNTTIAGDSVTVTAHGGAVSGSASAGGAGGSGSTNATHFAGGNGGAGGIVSGGGGGGGGSAGTAAGGNNGGAGTASAGGAGGASVTGGGPGGNGGTVSGNGKPPTSGPGGGGGGRGANGSANGAGFDGQITLSGFTSHPDARASFGLAGLNLNGTGTVRPSGSLALAGLGFAGTGATAFFKLLQNGPSVNNSGTTVTPTIPLASTAGTDLFAVFTSNGQQAFTTTGAGWQLVQFKASGAATGSIQLWHLPGNLNLGGITSNQWTIPTGGGTGHIMEWQPPVGYVGVLDGSVVTISGTTPVTSFPFTYGSATSAGDLGIVCMNDEFNPAPGSNPWGADPAGWTHQREQGSGVSDSWASLTNPNLAATTVSVTVTANTSTNQLGYAGILAIFKAVPYNTCAGGLALGGLSLNAQGNSVIPAGTVVGSGGLALGPLGLMSPDRTKGVWPQVPLPILVEIKINGIWVDITDRVYNRQPIQLTARGRPDESQTLQPTQCSMLVNNVNGDFTVGNPNGQYYPYLTRNTKIRVSVQNAVTITGANWSGYRFWGEVAAWPIEWDPTGSDVWVTINASGVFRRLRQSKNAGSPLKRYYRRVGTLFVQGAAPLPGTFPPFIISNPAGYWPCEDGQLATSFASGIPGGSPMTWTGGVPSLGGAQASSGVALGSDAFAVTNGTVWAGVPGAFSTGGQIFSQPGTFQWLCPGGINTVQIECFGGGGGGGNGIGQNGGGGGEWAQDLNVAVTPGNFYTVVVGAGGSGGIGHYTSGNDSTGGGIHGGDTTFTGDSVTVRAHAGRGATNNNPGAGGTGSTNQNHNDGGAGGNSGAGLGGAGGGGSGSNAGTGHAGQSQNQDIGGAGGTLRGDGGPGGTGGLGHGAHSADADATAGHTPNVGPGGGGGAGGFNNQSGKTGYGKPGGPGQNGQVSITFGTLTPTPSANVVRFLLLTPSAGAANNAQLCQFTTNGAVGIVNLLYTTANGGSLQLVGKSGGGTTLFTSAVTAFGLNGIPVIVSIELTQGGTTSNPTVAWNLKAVAGNATTLLGQVKGTTTGTLGNFTAININNGTAVDTQSGIGHIAAQYVVDPLINLSPALAAYNGELAANRVERLCDEENIPALIIGNASDTPQMGPQTDELVSDLMQECETADLGLLFEPRTTFGVGYQTRVSLQNQNATAQVDYSLAQVVGPLVPSNDELLVHNDVIAQRESGSSYEGYITTGTMSIQDPPNGIGVYVYNVNVNLFADNQLQNYVSWLLILGTIDQYRYPSISFDMRRAAVNGDVFSQIANLDTGDFLQIINQPIWLPPYPINQLCFGFKESLAAFEWTVTINGVPGDPYSGSSLPVW